MVYWGLSAVFLMLGFVSIFARRFALTLFLVACVIVPTASRFQDVVAQYGIYHFEYYYVGAIISIILSPNILIKMKHVQLYLVMIAYLIFVFIVSAALYDGGFDKYILRDARFMFSILFPVIILAQLESVEPMSLKFMSVVTLLAGISNMVIVFMIYFGVIKFGSYYYDVQNNFRYWGLGTYINIIYVIVAISRFSDFKARLPFALLVAALLASFAGVIICGYRTVVIAVAFGATVASLRSPGRAIGSALGGLFAVVAFIQLSYYLGVTRVIEALDLDASLSQLAVRFAPAAPYLDNLSVFSAVFGYGFGTTFFIQWFLYQGLDPFHNQVDSSFITTFVKLGLGAFAYLGTLLFLLVQGHSLSVKIGIIVFMLIYMFTAPVITQAELPVMIAFSVALGVALKQSASLAGSAQTQVRPSRPSFPQRQFARRRFQQ